MKIPRAKNIVIAISLLILTVLLVVSLILGWIINTPPPKPLLMKNGPGPFYIRPAAQASSIGDNVLTGAGNEHFGMLNYSGTPSSVHLQGHVVKVVSSLNVLYLTNVVAGPATNHFVVPQNSGNFNGDQVVTLSSGPNFWQILDLSFSGSSYSSNGVKDALLLALAKTEVGDQSYEGARIFAVASATNAAAATNFCNPIVGWNEAVTPGTEYTFSIKASDATNLPTNMALRSYLATVMKTVATNGGTVTTNFYLPKPAANLGTNYFVSGTGRFMGTNVIALTSGTTSEVKFMLKESAFANISDCHLIFVGQAVNSSGKCETALILPLDTAN